MHLKSIFAAFLLAVVLVDQAESWRVIRRVGRFVTRVVRRPIRKIGRFLKKPFKAIRRIVKGVGKIIKQGARFVARKGKQLYGFYKKNGKWIKLAIDGAKCATFLAGDLDIPRDLFDGNNKNYMEIDPLLLIQAYQDEADGVEEYPELTEDEWNELVADIQMLQEENPSFDEIPDFDHDIIEDHDEHDVDDELEEPDMIEIAEE